MLKKRIESQDKEKTLLEVAKEFFLPKEEAFKPETVEYVEKCFLANVFAQDSEETKMRINNLLEKLFEQPTLFTELGSATLDTNCSIKEQMIILEAFSLCDNKKILQQILLNDRINTGNLNRLYLNENPKISSLAKEKLQNILRKVSNKIAEKNVNVETWGTRSFYNISFNSVDEVFKDFKNRSTEDGSTRPQQLDGLVARL